MIIRTATIVIAMTALAAGAFGFAAGVSSIVQQTAFNPNAVTTIEKNQVWPIKGNITVEPCTVNLCQEV